MARSQGRLVATLALALLALPAAPATPEPTVDLASARAAAAGLPRLRSLLVQWRGELILERYYHGARATRTRNIKSASKSVISALVGIAIHRGYIESVDTPIAEYFPELTRADADPRKRTITIEDLLTMRSGLESTSGRNYGPWTHSRDWVRYILNRPMVADPGEWMDYSTGSTHLLSAILTKATGRSTWEFAREALAEPLGFHLARWPRDPQGIYFGGNDMELTSRQLLAFGVLYLNRGRIGDRQVVPAEWIEASWIRRGRSRWSGQRYGYGWWIRDLAGHRANFAWGYGGQYAFVIPELDLVIAVTSSIASGSARRDHQRRLRDLIERFIIHPIAAAKTPPVSRLPAISDEQ